MDDSSYYLAVLKHNQGFDEPTEWLDYAMDNNFLKNKAVKRAECPDCGHAKFNEIGQYIYYSHLMKIKECSHCSLIFSDVLLNRDTLIRHFESAYKDDFYFEEKRRTIFEQLSGILSNSFPDKKTIIDIGGAKGHLAKVLRTKNPKYNISINDLSKNACNYAQEHFGLKTYCCRIEELSSYKRRYDVLVIIDVLYYSENISLAWQSITKCTKDNGILLIRLPNKIWWIKFLQVLLRHFNCGKKKRLADHVYGINPEHIYFFNRSYLSKRLRGLGFKKVTYMPAVSLKSDNKLIDFISRVFYRFARLIHFISCEHITLTPSQLIIAQR